MENAAFFSVVAAAFTVGIAAVYFLARRYVGVFSKLVDRYQIRPSAIIGSMQILGGGLIFLGQFALPMSISAIQVVYVLAAAAAIAFGVQKIVLRPSLEYRPPWYEGEGKPDWSSDPPSFRFPPRVTLLWIVVVSIVCAVGFSGFRMRMSQDRLSQQKHNEAVSRVEELGGQVQQDTVNLAGTNVTDDDLRVLLELDNLREVNLGATNVTNKAMEVLVQLDLHRLVLSGTNVDDDGIRMLRASPQMRHLELRQTQVTGVGFPIESESQMILDLSGCPLTAEGLAAVAECGELLHVSFVETDIDDSCLDALKRISTRSLSLSETQLSKAAVEELRANDPDRNILHFQ